MISAGTALVSLLALPSLLLTSCSGQKDSPSHAPPMFDTGAMVPDPCQLIGSRLSNELVGPSTMTREKNDEENQDCSWQSKSDPSPTSKGPSGLLQVGAYAQRRQVKGAEKYSDAKITYKAAQQKRPCTPIKTSADVACWQEEGSGVRVALRKGYRTIVVSYVASHSPALEKTEKDDTAATLADEVLNHLHT